MSTQTEYVADVIAKTVASMQDQQLPQAVIDRVVSVLSALPAREVLDAYEARSEIAIGQIAFAANLPAGAATVKPGTTISAVSVTSTVRTYGLVDVLAQRPQFRETLVIK